MAIGDRVRAQVHLSYLGEDPIAIYQVPLTGERVLVDEDGIAHPTRFGGVKPGSLGTITGTPVKVVKEKLHGFEKVPSLGGPDTILLFPVLWDYYKQIAWIPQPFMQIVG